MPAFRATVHLLIEAESEAEACDAISALLTETGLYDDGFLLRDWSYIPNGQGFTGPRAVYCPPDYDRDEDDLNQLKPRP